MDPRFELSTEHGATVLRIRGDLDIALEEEAVGVVASTLAADPPPRVLVLDLSEVEFIDSSGLRALLKIHNRHGAKIRLGPVSAAVERLLDLTGTAELFSADEGRRQA
jgi:anti-sigma B factor antagonist